MLLLETGEDRREDLTLSAQTVLSSTSFRMGGRPFIFNSPTSSKVVFQFKTAVSSLFCCCLFVLVFFFFSQLSCFYLQNLPPKAVVID